jgi:hypothetical protein
MQANLAQAVAALGMREEGTKRLEAAVQEYNNALKVITRKELPFDWARIESLLAFALLTMSERKANSELMCQALIHYHQAWQAFSDVESSSPATLLAQRRVAELLEKFGKKFSKRDVSSCLGRIPLK